MSLVHQVKLSQTKLHCIWTLNKGFYSLVISDDHQEIARTPLSLQLWRTIAKKIGNQGTTNKLVGKKNSYSCRQIFTSENLNTLSYFCHIPNLQKILVCSSLCSLFMWSAVGWILAFQVGRSHGEGEQFCGLFKLRMENDGDSESLPCFFGEGCHCYCHCYYYCFEFLFFF